jgi:hypothetical protein
VKGAAFDVPVSRAEKALPREALDLWWYPERPGVELPPEAFRRELEAISPLLAVCRPPPGAPLPRPRAWLVWMMKPSVTYVLCPGWFLLFDWRSDAGELWPCDNRILANIYRVSARQFGNAKKYFDHCVDEMERTKKAKEQALTNDNRDRRKDFSASTRITNIGRGNKFAKHHDGTIAPGRGHANWLADTRRLSLSGDVRRDEERQTDERMDFIRKRRGERL